MKHMHKIIASLLLCCIFIQANAQDSAFEAKFNQFEKIQNNTTPVDKLDSLINVAEKEKMLQENKFGAKQFLYYQQSLDQRYQTFAWQSTSTKLIFLMVSVIVLCGLIFSGIHFQKAMKLQEKNPTAPAGEGNSLELSMQGVKINSSVIGLMILALSLGFFYLYLIYVYPINHVKLDPDTNKQTTEQVKKAS
ncbi:MAG TPA: hypothetical protein DIW54_00900 [Chitinophagaceae bacterium]|nr:hypothetical protein [Chitinophagaceae bacterium]